MNSVMQPRQECLFLAELGRNKRLRTNIRYILEEVYDRSRLFFKYHLISVYNSVKTPYQPEKVGNLDVNQI